MIAGYILCCGTCLSVGMYGMEGWLFNTMPDWNVISLSIITFALQMGRYFIKQLWYEMKYNSLIKMCTNLVNDIDHSITYAYLYPLIRMQPFYFGKDHTIRS